MRFYKFCLVLILLVFCSSCSFLGEKYFVVFEKAPNILSEKIVSMNFEIGTILEKQLSNDKIVIVTIKISSKYKEIIKDNGVFYVNEGKLIYETVGDSSSLLQPNSKILGFATQTDFLWFKTKYVLKDFTKTSINKAEELYEEFNQ